MIYPSTSKNEVKSKITAAHGFFRGSFSVGSNKGNLVNDVLVINGIISIGKSGFTGPLAAWGGEHSPCEERKWVLYYCCRGAGNSRQLVQGSTIVKRALFLQRIVGFSPGSGLVVDLAMPPTSRSIMPTQRISDKENLIETTSARLK